MSVLLKRKEQDKLSDIEQQLPFGDRNISNIQPQNRGGGLQNQQEHHIILTKYEAVHPGSTCLALLSSDVPILKQGDYSAPYKYTLEQMYSKHNYENLQSILNDKCIQYVKCHYH